MSEQTRTTLRVGVIYVIAMFYLGILAGWVFVAGNGQDGPGTPVNPFYVGLVFALVTAMVVATPILRTAHDSTSAALHCPQCQARIPLPLDNFCGWCRHPLRADSEERAAAIREKNARRNRDH
ncbi:zinc ribbon domain-containing protein [Rhodococcus qingshengii]|uniref:zinc ribbon domain-containing protein n=1 Tax=Rhodococcus qingshengii TaxID=334542 RepID=UPI001BE9D832|nr:zinc ribbon domain-containing protein [Rhodococcus qingshengii]MBT2270670.1 zinc ribbon domain-containing protein [Rhodococcus qingshengii]